MWTGSGSGKCCTFNYITPTSCITGRFFKFLFLAKSATTYTSDVGMDQEPSETISSRVSRATRRLECTKTFRAAHSAAPNSLAHCTPKSPRTVTHTLTPPPLTSMSGDATVIRMLHGLLLQYGVLLTLLYVQQQTCSNTVASIAFVNCGDIYRNYIIPVHSIQWRRLTDLFTLHA